MAIVSQRRRLVDGDRQSGRARGGTAATQRVSLCQPACAAAGPAVVATATDVVVVVATTVGHSGHLASARDRGARDDDDDDDDDGDVNIDPAATAAAAAAGLYR